MSLKKNSGQVRLHLGDRTDDPADAENPTGIRGKAGFKRGTQFIVFPLGGMITEHDPGAVEGHQVFQGFGSQHTEMLVGKIAFPGGPSGRSGDHLCFV